MQRLMSHIERLLLMHDCVIIPKVGGFVLQNYPASYNPVDHSFSPSGKEIVFNPTLCHNDGLLIESYMKLYNADFSLAQRMLEEDTEWLKEALRNKNRISLGSIGSFCANEEGKVIFTPLSTSRFNLSTYGLEAFSFPTLESLTNRMEKESDGEERRAKRKDIFYIPVNTAFLRTVITSAAAITLLLLISTPVKKVSQSSYTASFIPTSAISFSVDASNTNEVKSDEVAAGTDVYNPMNTGETDRFEANGPVEINVLEASDKEIAEVALKAKMEVTPPAVSHTAGNIKYYHIVVASLPTMSQADKYISRMDRHQYTQAGIVERDGKIRVYAARFTEREQAEQYLSSLRESGAYKDAWMFISR